MMLTFTAMAPDPPAHGSPGSMTADLFDRARAGDREALDEIFERHLPMLRRWASGRLPRWARDLTDTADLVQDTLTDSLKHLDRFEHRGEGAFLAYLRQAVINRIRNELRRTVRRGVAAPLDSGLEEHGTSPLEAAIGSEMLAQYDAALERLTPEEREAVLARVEVGLGYEEIARVLGKPTANAARMTVVRALVRLAEEMKRP
jgi:RNA polymerase sigma factor (sigma-70 family)